MFYADSILSKRGPLGQVWLAAHWDFKRLSKTEINRTDIKAAVGPWRHCGARVRKQRMDGADPKPCRRVRRRWGYVLRARRNGHPAAGAARAASVRSAALWRRAHLLAQDQVPAGRLQRGARQSEAGARRRPPSGQTGHGNLLAYMVGRLTCGKGRRTAKTFRAGAVDLAPDQATANYGAITIGDALFDLDAIAPILEQASGDFAGCAHTR